MTKYIGYVGTYTKKESKGIYSFTLDTNREKIDDIQLVAECDNPTYLAISEDNRYLYSVTKEGDNGGVSAYSINSANHKLHPINKEIAHGAPPCHVSLNKVGTTLLAANYHRGTLHAFSLEEDGHIKDETSIVHHHGSGPDHRQEKSHTHYAGYTPDEKYIIAVELGTDAIYTYEMVNGELIEKQMLSVEPGSGPRHIVFHPIIPVAYVMTEFSSKVLVLAYQSEDGSFQIIGSLSTIPDNFFENNHGSAIHLSSDGRFLYAGNRGHDSIAVFQINEETGFITLTEIVSTEGNWPRDFALDPSENFIIASNQESDCLVLFRRNQETGKLSLIQSHVFVPEPVCVKFFHY